LIFKNEKRKTYKYKITNTNEVKLVNWFNPDRDKNNFNGMECLAAQAVSYFKKEIGEFYLYPAGTRNVGEEFIYYIKNLNGKPEIQVEEVKKYVKSKRVS